MECLRLRVKDLDFAQRIILIRDGKGEKDRVTMLPETLVVPLQHHLRLVKRTHEEDLAKGHGAVYLPYALDCKYPNAEREWIWQYVFPANRLSVDPRSGVVRRHHVHESSLQKAARRSPGDGHTLADWPPHLPSLLCHPPSGRPVRHPHRPGARRPQGRQDDHDLHPRPQPEWSSCPQPAGLLFLRLRLYTETAH
jgi:hypothetical protein